MRPAMFTDYSSKPRTSAQVLICTDLDGTLLDHYSYDYLPAKDLLASLAAAGTPVILSSSKTRAELEPIRARLGNAHPFVVENGAAVFIPRNYFAVKPRGCAERDGYWVKDFGHTRSQCLAALERQRTRFDGYFASFDDLGVEGIAEATGLSDMDAALANTREYTEPVLWQGPEPFKQAFINEILRTGTNVQRGGRFLHLTGPGDKGVALSWLVEAFKRANSQSEIKSIAIGDSANDVPMLDLADCAIVIRSPVNPPPRLSRGGHIYHSTQTGPAGWNECVRKVLNL